MSVNFQQGGRYGENSKICLLLLIPTSSIHWNEAKRVLLRFESQLRGASQIHPFHTPNVKYLQWCPKPHPQGCGLMDTPRFPLFLPHSLSWHHPVAIGTELLLPLGLGSGPLLLFLQPGSLLWDAERETQTPKDEGRETLALLAQRMPGRCFQVTQEVKSQCTGTQHGTLTFGKHLLCSCPPPPACMQIL